MEVQVRDLKRQPYLGIRDRTAIAGVGGAVATDLKRLFERIAEAGSRPAGPPFLTAVEVAEETISFEVGVPCDGAVAATTDIQKGELPPGRAAVYEHHGAYEELADLSGQLMAWVESHGHRASGPVREVYLTAPDDPRGLVTELVCPLADSSTALEK